MNTPHPERAPDQASRIGQVWTIAKIELRRVFFARRSLWIYALALLPSVIFFGHSLDTQLDRERLARKGLTSAALIDGVREGDSVDDVKKSVGKPSEERWGTRTKRVRKTGGAGITTHVIHAAIEARFVRLNIS